MKAIFNKEFSAFFSSLIGYLILGVFIIVSGLFLFVFESPFNIPDSGIASLEPFFQLAPWLLLLLIPAITMRSIAQEINDGTMELLLTSPVSIGNLIVGKWLAALVTILIALSPILLYTWAINEITLQGSLDVGQLASGLLGLVLICVAMTAIGIFASTIAGNPLVAFLIGIVLILLFYFGMGAVGSSWIAVFGMQFHYDSFTRGVIDTRGLLYFISVAFVFLFLSITMLKSRYQS